MMPTELRYGNFVYYEDDTYSDRAGKIAPHVFRVILISGDMIQIDMGFDARQRFERSPIWSPTLDELKGVPLTGQWLERFGFTEDFDVYMFNKVEISSVSDHWVFDTPQFLTRLQYVHQLQNLYFSLTEQELTLPTL